MAITYPGTLDTFVNPTGTSTLDSPDHALQHSNVNDAIEAVQAVVGTTAGTAVLKDFTAGEFPIKQEGGTLVETITGGTINTTTLGTPSVTGGSFASPTTTGTDAGTATFTNKTLTSPVIQAYDGWQDANETWTYASADDPTYTFTIASFDATAKYYPGMRIKLTNASVKYFIITKVTFDDPGSTITVYGGTDYDLANSAITANYYSTQKAPLNFPLDPTKWTVETTDTSNRSQSSPTVSTWYNLGSLSINIPIGCWSVSYQVTVEGQVVPAADINTFITLSTANNTESDSNFTSFIGVFGVSTTIYTNAGKNKILTLGTKDTYYLNALTSRTNNIFFRGDLGATIIRAVCAYL